MNFFESFKVGSHSPREVMRQTSFYRMNQWDRGQGGKEPVASNSNPFGGDAMADYSSPLGSAFGMTPLETELMLNQDWRGLGATRYGDPNYFSDYVWGNQGGLSFGGGSGSGGGETAGGGGTGGGGTVSDLAPNAVEPVSVGSPAAPTAMAGGNGASTVTVGNGGWWSGMSTYDKVKTGYEAASTAYSAYKNAKGNEAMADYAKGEAAARAAYERERIARIQSGPLAKLAPYLMQQALGLYGMQMGNVGGGFDFQNMQRLMGVRNEDLAGMPAFSGWFPGQNQQQPQQQRRNPNREPDAETPQEEPDTEEA